AFAKLQCRCDIVHRGRVVSLLLKQARRLAQNLLAGISCGFTRHEGEYINFKADLCAGDRVARTFLSEPGYSIWSAPRPWRVSTPGRTRISDPQGTLIVIRSRWSPA